MTKIIWLRFAFVALTAFCGVYIAFRVLILPAVDFAREQPRFAVTLVLLAVVVFLFVKAVKMISRF